MPLGPGKYGAQAEEILRKHGGALCVVMLLGPEGPGFDVAAADPANVALLPQILRMMADSIEADIKPEKAGP